MARRGQSGICLSDQNFLPLGDPWEDFALWQLELPGCWELLMGGVRLLRLVIVQVAGEATRSIGNAGP